MKIKKQMTVKTARPGAAVGGATIADRFKIDPTAGKAQNGSSSASAKVAFFAALIAFGLLGGMVWFLYQTVEFQKVVMVED
jgi:hypothetical protein